MNIYLFLTFFVSCFFVFSNQENIVIDKKNEKIVDNNKKDRDNSDDSDDDNVSEDETNDETDDEDNENIEDNKYYSINKSNYENLKFSIINKQKIHAELFMEIDKINEWIKNFNKQSKKNKKKLKEEYELKKQKIKQSNKKIGKKIYLDTLFSRIIERSTYYKDFLKNEPSLTVNELNALRIFDGKNDKSLSDILFTNTSDLINILNGFKIINHNSDLKKTVEDMKFFKDSNILSLDEYFVQLNKVENGFIKLFTDQTAYKRFKLEENQFNAYIDFRDKIIKRNSVLNKKFLNIFVNPMSLTLLILFRGLHVPVGIATGKLSKHMGDIYKMSYGTFIGIYKVKVGYDKDKPIYINIFNKDYYKDPLGIFSLIFGGFTFAFWGYEIYKIHRYFNPNNFYSVLAKKYYKIKKYISTMRLIYEKIKEDDALYEKLKDKLVQCERLFNEESDLNKEQKLLIRIIEELPEEWSYWKNFFKINSRATKFCKMLMLFDRNKEMFIDAIVEIANIGTIIDNVKLLNKEEYKDKICIPEISNDKDPMIKADNAWNPFLDPKIAVPNNIRLGKNIKDDVIKEKDDKGNDVEKTIKNGYKVGLLYGMNAGGKTTIIESVGFIFLLSKSYGFCFASKAILSDISRIFTVIDVTTDISKGYSRYMSELITVDELLETIKRLNAQGKRVLVLCDEVFAGTNPEAAGLLSTNVIRKIVNSGNVIALIATHNIKPTELEKNSNLIRNLYMEVDTSNNDVKHKYKVKQGLEKQSIAESIVRKFQKTKKIRNGNDILGEQI